MNEKISLQEVVDIIFCIADKIISNSDILTELDSKIGDSDHGENMKRGFQSLKRKKNKLEKVNSLKGLFKEVGDQLIFNIGGSAGPLFGKLFTQFGHYCGEEKKFSVDMLLPALESSLNGIKELGGAEVGDKTMIDTINPVVEFLKEIDLQNYECEELLRQVKAEAKEGLESTRGIVAKKGRASYLKDRSKGHLDPGAYSCYLIFESIEEYYNPG